MTAFALLPLVSRALVLAAWGVFFVMLIVWRRRKGPETVAKKDPVSNRGIVLQAVGFFFIFLLQRPIPRAGTRLGPVEIAMDVLAPVLSIASGAFGLAAIRTLGKQWSYTARLIDTHALVTAGPYRIVRHPIYTAMFGKLLATNFALGHWIGLILGGIAFVIGTLVRIRSEEKLLRDAFGPQYDDYARRVPAFIPVPLRS